MNVTEQMSLSVCLTGAWEQSFGVTCVVWPLQDIYDQLWEEEVVRNGDQFYFINRKIKYVWDDATCIFVRLR